MLKTHKFARKPFYVDAVRVSEANMADVAEWCDGTIEISDQPETKGQKFVLVKVHRPLNDRQTQAFIGDWVLFAGSGYKVYVPKAFDKSFEKVRTLTKAQADEAGIKVPHEPRPAKKSARPKPSEPKRKPTEIGTNIGEVIKEAEATKNVVFTQKGTGHQVTLPADEVERFRSAETGQFVTEEEAEANPATTVKETVDEVPIRDTRTKEQVEADKLIAEVLREK